MTERAWRQCTLPVKFGGLGVRTASEIALPAFLSSSYACNLAMCQVLPQSILVDEYMDLTLARTRWIEVAHNAETPLVPSIQAHWDRPLCKIVFEELLAQSSSDQDRARILATSSEHASDWLNSIPIPTLGFKLDNSQLRIVCALRLGSPMCQPHNCNKCGTAVDSSGVHGLSCRMSGGRFPRHYMVNDLIKRALSTANYPSILEPNGVSRTDGKRPDGMTVFPWKSGKTLVWDFTCSDTVAPSHIPISASTAGKVADNAEKAKLVKYSNLEANFIVAPVCVETLGPWGPSGLKLIRDIGSKIKKLTNEPRSTAFLMQAISMAVQRGNAASILGTVANPKTLEEIYSLA